MVKFRINTDIEPGDIVYKKGNNKITGTVVHTTTKTATVCFEDYPVIIPKSRLRKVPWNFITRKIREVNEWIKR